MNGLLMKYFGGVSTKDPAGIYAYVLVMKDLVRWLLPIAVCLLLVGARLERRRGIELLAGCRYGTAGRWWRSRFWDSNGAVCPSVAGAYGRDPVALSPPRSDGFSAVRGGGAAAPGGTVLSGGCGRPAFGPVYVGHVGNVLPELPVRQPIRYFLRDRSAPGRRTVPAFLSGGLCAAEAGGRKEIGAWRETDGTEVWEKE